MLSQTSAVTDMSQLRALPMLAALARSGMARSSYAGTSTLLTRYIRSIPVHEGSQALSCLLCLSEHSKQLPLCLHESPLLGHALACVKNLLLS